MDLKLDERGKKILQAIVQSYIKTAEPIGSRTISRHYNLGISPATIRNVMNDLEELGFIAQPHTSAGRIPTHKGYRYYVDTLMDKPKLSKQEEENIQTKYIEKGSEPSDEIFRLTSRLLSVISNCTGLATAPNISESTVKKIEFIPVAPKKILLLLITNSNIVKNKLLDLSEDITADELQCISRMFTCKFERLSLHDIDENVINKIDIKKQSYSELYKNTINFIKNSLSQTEHEKDIFVEGTSNILRHPEFSHIERTKELFKTLEEKKDLSKFFEKIAETNGVKVFIGEETKILNMEDCSLVISSYKIKGYPSGIIGIIGPTRMKYGKIFSIVEFTSCQLEKTLEDLIK